MTPGHPIVTICNLCKQFFHNINEADWVSRHVADSDADEPLPQKETDPETPVSCLSLALHQMGLIKPQ